MTLPPTIKRFQALIILATIAVVLIVPATITPFYSPYYWLARVLAGLWPFFLGAAIYITVRRINRNPVVAVLTVILLIAAYIRSLYLALVYGIEHSDAGF